VGEPSGLPYPLLVRERRVLVPIGRRCPFGCLYCYASDDAIESTQPVDHKRIIESFSRLDSNTFDIIQLGFDGDPLASASALRELLPTLCESGKHVNISTKGTASAKLRRFLGAMHRKTPLGISLNVSAACWESAPRLEPRTPKPYLRLKSASRLMLEQSVPFVLSIRPIIPTVPDFELYSLLDCAQSMEAAAAVTGPLYVEPNGANTTWTTQKFDYIKPEKVEWSPVNLQYRRIHDRGRIELLRKYSDSIGLPLFSENSQALRYLIEKVHS
jgi:DNA repair photolyase